MRELGGWEAGIDNRGVVEGSTDREGAVRYGERGRDEDGAMESERIQQET